MTRRYGEVWCAAFFPDKEIVHRLVIPAGSILAGAVFFPCLKPVGAYIAFMGLCQFLMYSGIRTRNQTRQMDQEDRNMEREWRIAELTEGRGHPEGDVQIAETRHRHKARETADFSKQWKGVLDARKVRKLGQSLKKMACKNPGKTAKSTTDYAADP